MKDWSYFDRFESIIDAYMPLRGEGDNMASQIVTAVNKLIYKWYNDGDTYDNVHTLLDGWANDLSTYANWLYHYTTSDVGYILVRIYNCVNGECYEDLLADLAKETLNEQFLEAYKDRPIKVSIYNCRELGPFEFKCGYEDEDY